MGLVFPIYNLLTKFLRRNQFVEKTSNTHNLSSKKRRQLKAALLKTKRPKLEQNIAVSMKLFTLDYVVNEDLHLLVF